jgi:hypothetical protein
MGFVVVVMVNMVLDVNFYFRENFNSKPIGQNENNLPYAMPLHNNNNHTISV